MPDGLTDEEEAAILAQLEQDLAEEAKRLARGEPVDRAPVAGHNRAMLTAVVIAGCS